LKSSLAFADDDDDDDAVSDLEFFGEFEFFVGYGFGMGEALKTFRGGSGIRGPSKFFLNNRALYLGIVYIHV
jgi:hypothetical protein